MEESILEPTTKISREKLVNIICEFYWDMGHEKIQLTRSQGDSITYENYDPLKTIANTIEISGISILISKECNERFDFVTISLEDTIFKNKILWGVDQKIRIMHVIFAAFFVLSFIATIIYGYHNIYPTNYFLSKYGTALFAVLIYVPLITLLYYLFEHKVEKVQSHPTTMKYKEEFEEFINQKEKEMFPEDIQF
jgi:hypothetical protein